MQNIINNATEIFWEIRKYKTYLSQLSITLHNQNVKCLISWNLTEYRKIPTEETNNIYIFFYLITVSWHLSEDCLKIFYSSMVVTSLTALAKNTAIKMYAYKKKIFKKNCVQSIMPTLQYLNSLSRYTISNLHVTNDNWFFP